MARERDGGCAACEAERKAILAACKAVWPDEVPCAEEYRWAAWVDPEYRIGHKRPFDAAMYVEGYGKSWSEAAAMVRARGFAFDLPDWLFSASFGEQVQSERENEARP